MDFLNLQRRPFVNAPGTEFFTANDQVGGFVRRLQQVLLAREALALVTGGPGVGKSTLIEAAWADVRARAVVVHADLRQVDSRFLADMLLLGLGGSATTDNEGVSLHRLREAISAHNDDGRLVTAAIDVPGLTADSARRIIQLAQLSAHPRGQFNIILQGPHTLHDLLNVPGLMQLRQRLCLRHKVRSLTIVETGTYMARQIAAAGGQPESMLASDVAPAVYAFVGGVPRLINTLMYAVLTEAAMAKKERIGADFVNQTAVGLGWKPLSESQSAKPASSPARQGAAVATGPRPMPAAKTAPADAGRGSLTSSDAPAALMARSAKNPDSREAAMTRAARPVAAQAGDTGIVKMKATDTSATGMLRLEDLDARIAESVFGQEAAALFGAAAAQGAPK